MLAATLVSVRQVEIGRRPVPAPGADDLLVRVLSTGVCGSDLAAWRGDHPYKRPPIVLGHEFAGEVVVVGQDVRGFEVGQRITSSAFAWCGTCEACMAGRDHLCVRKRPLSFDGWDGTFAEYVRLPASMCFRLPGAVGSMQAALVEPLSIGLHALRLAPAVGGRRLAVIGSGSIGLATLLCSRLLGVERVVCTDVDERKRRLALDCGASGFAAAGAGGWQESVTGQLGGAADVTVVASGHRGVLEEAVGVTRDGGTIVVVAYASSRESLDVNAVVQREIRLQGSALSNADDVSQVIEWLESGALDPLPMITHAYPLSRTDEAMALMHLRAETVGKIVLDVANDPAIPEARG